MQDGRLGAGQSVTDYYANSLLNRYKCFLLINLSTRGGGLFCAACK